MHSSHKDGFPTDSVHVDACACLQVVQVEVAKLGDEVDDIILGAHLHTDIFITHHKSCVRNFSEFLAHRCNMGSIPPLSSSSSLSFFFSPLPLHFFPSFLFFFSCFWDVATIKVTGSSSLMNNS